MVENLKMILLNPFVKLMDLFMNFPHLSPQQNGVVERKNRSLQEMARTMMHETNLAKYLWAEAVNTACYVQNRIFIRPILNKTAYELFKGRKPNISYFHQFGCTCYILNNKVHLKKFDAKAYGDSHQLSAIQLMATPLYIITPIQ
jgi:hypothetical protein